jgi:hypothetical protein
MDKIESFPVACSGGLVTNLPQLAQAAQFPGSARELENFEPSVEGGYRRINGYAKWSSTPVSALPIVWTRQAYSIGATSINVAGWYSLADTNGTGAQTFTLLGSSSTTTYTITSITGDPSSSNSVHATIAFTPALDVNVSARAFVALNQSIFSSFVPSLIPVGTHLIVNNEYGNTSRNQNNLIYLSLGNYLSGSTYYSRVDGAGQTGTTFTIKNLKHRPEVSDSFWISTSSGTFPDTYVIKSVSAYDKSAGTATLVIYPSLSSSPSNEELIRWLRRPRNMSTYMGYLFAGYTKGTTNYAAYPAGDRYPLLFTSAYYEPITDLYDIVNTDEDALIASAYYRNHLFWASQESLYFSAPFNEFDYSSDNGAGQIIVPGTVVGLLSLRDSLIVFCRYNIFRLTGSSSDSFALSPITENIGCVDGMSIQEINGDILYLSDTGISRLSDSDQQSGLGLSVVSNTIKTEVNTLLAASVNGINLYPSVFIPTKGQYRVFKLNNSTTVANTVAIAGSQVSSNATEIQWSLLKGIKPSALSFWKEENKTMFLGWPTNSGDPTYIYVMDSGNTFDGTNITATYSTPYYTINDPKVRKSFLKLTMTVEPEGNVTTTVDTLLNYNKSDVIQPPSVVLGTTSSTYGDTSSPSYETLLIGNGESVSLKFSSNTNIPPYVIQSFSIEYSNADRR